MVNRQTSEHKTFAVLGGLGMVNGKFGSRAEVLEFDPETRDWSIAPIALPEPRGMFEAVPHAEAIWMFGGSDTGHNSQLYRTVLHWWGDVTTAAPLPDVTTPHPRRSFGGALIGNEYFLVGGLGDGNEIVDRVDVFDFESRTWRDVPAPHISRVFPTVCSDGDKLYLFGGFTNRDGHFAECSTLECYDNQSEQWSIVAEEPPGVDASMRMLSVAGRLLFFGIDRETSDRANFVMFDPAPTAIPATVEGMSFGARQRGSEAENNAKLMMRRDSDKDGKLSTEELGSRFASFVVAADKDQDGLVSFAELKNQLEAEEAAQELADSLQQAAEDARRAAEAARQAAEAAEQAAEALEAVLSKQSEDD